MLAVYFLLGFIPLTSGYYHGAPCQALYSLFPNHDNILMQNSSLQNRYLLKVTNEKDKSTAKTYEAGETYRIRLSGTGFRGFLMQVRHVRENGRIDEVHRLGRFLVDETWEEQGVKLLSCSPVERADSITHSDNHRRESIEVLWRPEIADGTVQVIFTVVEEKERFWTNQMFPAGRLLPVKNELPAAKTPEIPTGKKDEGGEEPKNLRRKPPRLPLTRKPATTQDETPPKQKPTTPITQTTPETTEQNEATESTKTTSETPTTKVDTKTEIDRANVSAEELIEVTLASKPSESLNITVSSSSAEASGENNNRTLLELTDEKDESTEKSQEHQDVEVAVTTTTVKKEPTTTATKKPAEASTTVEATEPPTTPYATTKGEATITVSDNLPADDGEEEDKSEEKALEAESVEVLESIDDTGALQPSNKPLTSEDLLIERIFSEIRQIILEESVRELNTSVSATRRFKVPRLAITVEQEGEEGKKTRQLEYVLEKLTNPIDIAELKSQEVEEKAATATTTEGDGGATNAEASETSPIATRTTDKDTPATQKATETSPSTTTTNVKTTPEVETTTPEEPTTTTTEEPTTPETETPETAAPSTPEPPTSSSPPEPETEATTTTKRPTTQRPVVSSKTGGVPKPKPQNPNPSGGSANHPKCDADYWMECKDWSDSECELIWVRQNCRKKCCDYLLRTLYN